MIKHPLEDLIETYLYEKDITTQTREVYQTILKQYIAFIKTNHISHATTQDVEIYLDVIRNKGCSIQWIRLQITVLKGLYHYLCKCQCESEPLYWYESEPLVNYLTNPLFL